MSFLLDTNVISEMRRARPHGGVSAWLGSISDDTLHISAVTIGELQNGIEKLRGIDGEKAGQLEISVDSVVLAFDIVAVDERSFRRWARLIRKGHLSCGGMR